MSLQGSGPISLSQISSEFGLPPSKNFGAYRVSETYSALTNMPLDTGVPQSGPIKFSDFYNKKLNIIVDCYSGTAATPPAPFHFDSLSTASNIRRLSPTPITTIPTLSTYSPTPSIYPSDAPITSPNFVLRYGVSPINLRDNSVLNDGSGGQGIYEWTYASVSIPADGTYRVKAVADDVAEIRIGSIPVIMAGFNNPPDPEPRRIDRLITILAGTYNIAVRYTQGPYGSIAGGNFSYFALTIDRVISPTSGSAASSLEKIGIKNRFNNNFVYMIGGFRGKPSSTSGHKVIAHVNTLIFSSTKGRKDSVALRSGDWDSGTEFIIDIGPDGRIIGSGGNGGNGGSPGLRGQDGGSAIGIVWSPVTVRNRGVIQRGHGGGGGGNAGSFNTVQNVCRAVGTPGTKSRRTVCEDVTKSSTSSGGGGGGGAGYPIGFGGNPGGNISGEGSSGSRGQDATQTTSRPFIIGSTVRGGTGGGSGTGAGSGGNGGPPTKSGGSPGAPPGDNGFAFVIYNDGSGVTITNLAGGQIERGGVPDLYNTIGSLI